MVAILEQTFRDEWGGVVATLIRFLGDFDLAEEAAQEAFAIAAEDYLFARPMAADTLLDWARGFKPADAVDFAPSMLLAEPG